MAYEKKNTTKKNTTKKATSKPVTPEPIEVEEEIVEEPVIEEKSAAAPPVKEKKQFRADDLVMCRSVTVGKLCMVGASSNMVYRWMNYGDEIEVEYRDLSNAVRSHSSYIYTPYIIIEDDDFIDEFLELKKFYKEKFTIKELTDILDMNESEMEDAIAVLPKGAKEQFINIASTQIANGELDSVRKIKTLERILNVDFSMVAGIQ